MLTLHVDRLKGKNTHHILEAAFKGLAIALKEAVKIDGSALPTTKGKL
jgi:imidazoleglycerol-phosphate dehydratase